MKPISVPVYCPACGAIFPSASLSFGNDVKGLVLNRNLERCTQCGGIAQVVDGVFDIANNIISVISAPKYTHDILTQLEHAAREAYHDKINIEELAEKADQVNPELGKTIRSPVFRGTYKPGIIILLLIIVKAISSCISNVDTNLNVDINVNEIIEQLCNRNQQEIIDNDQNL